MSSFSLISSSLLAQALVQAVGHETTELFSELAKNVSQTGSRVIDLLNSHEIFLGNVIEGHVYKLEQERAQLQWMSEELSRVAAIEDNICFLKVVKPQVHETKYKLNILQI